MTDRCKFCSKPEADCECPEGFVSYKAHAGEWIQPVRRGYRMECCDCGLAHILNFRIRKGKIQFQAFREQ